MNINQGIISPKKPNILKNERIYVYVPKATNDSAGIASFSNDYFYVDVDSKVHIKLTNPFETPSLVKLDDIDFKKDLSRNEIQVNWVYAHNPVSSNNTNGYGLMKIGKDSVGYLRYNNGLLEVDYDKLAKHLEKDMFDSSMSDSSTNGVQNKVVKSYIDTSIKQTILDSWEGSY